MPPPHLFPRQNGLALIVVTQQLSCPSNELLEEKFHPSRLATRIAEIDDRTMKNPQRELMNKMKVMFIRKASSQAGKSLDLHIVKRVLDEESPAMTKD